MKTYEAFDSSPEGWNINSTLKLEANGRFSYSEGWTDYTNASLSAGAGGTWRRDGNTIIFKAERVYGRLAFQWGVGMEWSAAEEGDTLVFGNGWRLSEPGEHMIRVLVHNRGDRPLPVRLKPPPAPEPELPLQPPPYVPPRVNPFPISPELAARLRGWIDELPTEGLGNWVRRLAKQHDALPLHGTQFLMWALRTDGQVLVIDHESASQSVEPETNNATARAAIAEGARLYPELSELLADDH